MQTSFSDKMNNFKRVVEILFHESAAIARSAAKLDRVSVEKAIELIMRCESKVIVIGIGKSGVIAQKIAQTLTSTGITAIYLHPSDALHGSLGLITAGDVVIALSNSGETDEILAITPSIKNRGVSIISIVGNLHSTLAARSDVVLDASVDTEACPLNLAPTTSTTVALVIGDAIAMSIMETRGLSAEDFAANHPAGRLGKRLTMTVGHLMHSSPNISPNANWMDVVRAISKSSLGAVNVIDNGKLTGIVTDGDLRRSIEKNDGKGLAELTAGQMMTTNPITATISTLAFDALRLMENRPSQISVLPVVDEAGSCVGLLRLHDIVRSGL